MAQRISVSLQGENARAVLRRLVEDGKAKQGQFWEGYEGQDPMDEEFGETGAGDDPVE